LTDQTKKADMKLIKAYERFIPQEILKMLRKEDITEVRLGNQIEKEMTVMFSDIRGFTSISEEMTPQNNFDFINSYLSRMEPVVRHHNGIVDKYVGDAIMALFPSSADDALKCAVSMLNKLDNYNNERKSAGQEPIKIGIGLNTGLCMLGTVGGENRMETTVIADAVNLASRIESMTKNYSANILISENTFHHLNETRDMGIRFLDRVNVKGKIQPQSVYEVFENDPPECREKKVITIKVFEEALAHYHFKHIQTAMELLEKCLSVNPSDIPAHVYHERCKEFFRSGFHESTGEIGKPVVWTRDLEFGVPEIDEQHQELFAQVNRLMEVVFKGNEMSEIKETVSFLDEFVLSHFEKEEALMDEYDYPFSHFQKLQHNNFKDVFSSLKEEIKVLDDTNRLYTLFRIQLLVVDWLVTHTAKLDVHLGRFIKRKQRGQSTL
jgi:hemerythrin-like metal-binding protein